MDERRDLSNIWKHSSVEYITYNKCVKLPCGKMQTGTYKILQQRCLVPLLEMIKCGINAKDINNTHIGEEYPIPIFINTILSKFPAYIMCVFDSNRIMTHMNVRFNINFTLLNTHNKMQIPSKF